MEDAAVRRYLHDLNNALNAAKINAFILRRTHGAALDAQAIDQLDASLLRAEQLCRQWECQISAQIPPKS